MRKRVLSFLLAASAAFCFICSSAPEAHAIVPLGLVQSALASYVTSTGYKMYNDQGTGQDILGSLSDLYQTWLDSPAGAVASQWTLAHIAAIEAVYTDTSGQIVIKKAAADVFQQFADWIQSEYSVSVGSETPTVVLESGTPVWSNSAGVNALRIDGFPDLIYLNGNNFYANTSVQIGTRNGSPVYLCCTPSNRNSKWWITRYDSYVYVARESASEVSIFAYSPSESGTITALSSFNSSTKFYSSNSNASSEIYSLVPFSTVEPSLYTANSLASGGLASTLAVTLAQAVADVVGQAKDDDAVVIGVGAGVGATAQDIADMVAQGVKAQTLDPSVSITAEAVIDTPVQPYPDIDGLGLPTLGAALVERFPFCIPWDFVDTLRLFSADPQPINIKVDLIPQRIKTSVGITSDTSFDIDLSGQQYAKIGVFCRWGSLITFCFGLFLITKRLVWTA